MSIATNVRKTISRTMIAASRPSASEVPCSIGGNSASPLYSTVTPAGCDRVADGVLDGDDRVAVGVLDRLVELRLGVGDPAVLRRTCCWLNGSPTLSMPGLAGGGLELAAS